MIVLAFRDSLSGANLKGIQAKRHSRHLIPRSQIHVEQWVKGTSYIMQRITSPWIYQSGMYNKMKHLYNMPAVIVSLCVILHSEYSCKETHTNTNDMFWTIFLHVLGLIVMFILGNLHFGFKAESRLFKETNHTLQLSYGYERITSSFAVLTNAPSKCPSFCTNVCIFLCICLKFCSFCWIKKKKSFVN